MEPQNKQAVIESKSITKFESSTDVTFNSIKEFVYDLNAVFGTVKKNAPIDLYFRLIGHVTEKDINGTGTKKYIDGFKVFFANYEDKLESLEQLMTLPRDTFIRYGDSPRAFLEIQKYLYKANKEQREIIRQHLLAISVSIDPSEKKLTAMESAAPMLEKLGLGGSKEAQYVTGIFNKTKKSMENSDSKDPMAALSSLLPVLPEIMGGLFSGIENGSLDINKLGTCMTGALTDLMNSNQAVDENGDPVEGQSNTVDFDKLVLGMQGFMSAGNQPSPVSATVTEVNEEDID